MARCAIYTAKKEYPIYAYWRCPKCEEINFSEGYVYCKASTVVAKGASRKKHNEAMALSEEHIQYLLPLAFRGLILSFNKVPKYVRENLRLKNAICADCKKKAPWDKRTMYKYSYYVGGWITIVCGSIAVLLKTSIAAWVLFGVGLCLLAVALLSDIRFKRMILRLPKKYVPVIGTQDPDLIAQTNALKNGFIKDGENAAYRIPTPEQAYKAVRNENRGWF